MMVSGLFVQGTTHWDEEKLRQLVSQEDYHLIRKLSPSITGANDTINWCYTRLGDYLVKSSYHLAHGSFPNQNMSLYQKLWNLQVSPKVKHFWWRVLHNGIPVLENLQKRKLRIDANCVFCGEHEESINHLLFTCRFSKEIWELSPINDSIKRQLGSNDIHRNVEVCLAEESMLFLYIGWRLWKAKNDLIFQNKKWSLPRIINQAILEEKLWKEANAHSSEEEKTTTMIYKENLLTKAHHPNQFTCFVDASWKTSEEKAGFGWILKSIQGREIMRGYGSLDLVMSSLEAEAIALREAMYQIRRWGYQDVCFYGDAKELYEKIISWTKWRKHQTWKYHELAIYMKDIFSMILSSKDHRFCFVKREQNVEADYLAKYTRSHSLPYVVSWY